MSEERGERRINIINKQGGGCTRPPVKLTRAFLGNFPLVKGQIRSLDD